MGSAFCSKATLVDGVSVLRVYACTKTNRGAMKRGT
jgi:hypothetical protein